MTLQSFVELAINAIVRPPRRNYSFDSLPTVFTSSDGDRFSRHPITFVNERGQKLVGSIYVDERYCLSSGLPCVVYLHGNASSQLEGQFLIPNLCPYGFAVYLFDFAGCGNSEGDYISLGLWEGFDINFLIARLSNTFNFQKFILWGRSMGAATAILCRNPSVIGIIVDSAYTSIPSIVKTHARRFGIPRFLTFLAVWFLVCTVWDIAGFDIRVVRPKDACRLTGNPPLIMAHSRADDFVSFEMGEKLFRNYSSTDKQFVELEGRHNDARPVHWFRTCYRFIFEKTGIDFGTFRLVSFESFDNHGAHFASLGRMLAGSRDGDELEDGNETCMVLRIVSDDEDSCSIIR
jgi:pimeloyl-ACP methyl ester carboxylesterase